MYPREMADELLPTHVTLPASAVRAEILTHGEPGSFSLQIPDFAPSADQG